jgi:hypothetical protein
MSGDDMLDRVRASLGDTYKPEGVDIYLRSRNRNLSGRTPLELIANGDGQQVLDEADRLAGGTL